MVELLEVFGNDLTVVNAAHARLYGLRNDPHAQKVGELLSAKFPISWKALTQ